MCQVILWRFRVRGQHQSDYKTTALNTHCADVYFTVHMLCLSLKHHSSEKWRTGMAEGGTVSPSLPCLPRFDGGVLFHYTFHDQL